MYDRDTVNELNELSMSVFGAKSRWRKLVEKGVAELVLEDTTRLHPNGDKETVKTPLMHVGKSGGELPQCKIVRYTVESVKEKMLSLKTQREAMFAAIKKQQEDQKAAEAAAKAVEQSKEVVAQASGSSL